MWVHDDIKYGFNKWIIVYVQGNLKTAFPKLLK